jgi:hypothetical protein
VLSNHPNTLRKYEDVLSGSVRSGRRAIVERLRLVRTLWSALSAEALDLPSPGGQVDVLFVSHLVNAAHADEDSDFYFGDLPHALAALGLSSLVALRNHLPRAGALTHRVRRDGVAARLLLPRARALGAELRALSEARREGGRLVAAARLMEDGEVAAIANAAAAHAATESTLATLRLHAQVTELCRRYRPRAVVVTYEGHAWERVVFQAARAVDDSVQCIGYQHTILFPGSHAVGRAIGPPYDPDVVLTVGDVTRDLLRARRESPETRFVTYGTHRRSSGRRQRVNDRPQCLVIPEGLESECVTLCDFAIECARRSPHVRFVLRMHPVFPFERLLERHSRFAELPANVVLSECADIADDFAMCRWALYRGSSAAVHALLAGVRPFYVHRPEDPSIDPLDALDTWRIWVADPEEVSARMERDGGMTAGEWEAASIGARSFADRYVMAADPEVVAALLRD